jgi:tetratricopeptide (TPR) repeat protein
MSQKTKQAIVFIAVVQTLLTIGIFVLPQVVQALPGEYYVRLQNHPLTAGVMRLVTTPIPEALPAPALAAAASANQAPAVSLPDIPGLPATALPQPPSPTPQPTATSQLEVMATAVATATIAATPTATPTAAPTATLEPLPASMVLEGLGSVAQKFNNCGPANLTIVLNYHGDGTTQDDAAAYLKPNREDRNVSPWQISDYVNDFTALRSTVHSGGNLAMLKRFIVAGLPVVIEKGYEPNSTEGWYGHYLTVYGYDDTTQEIYSKDTNLGPFDGRPRLDSYADFLHWWQQFNYTFYVVYEPGQEALVQSIIPAQLLEAQAMWQYTSQLANEEIQANPENAFAWFNLGVSQTRLGELTGEAAYYQSGAQAFDQARTAGLPPRTLFYEHRPFMAYWKVSRLDDVIELADTLLETVGGRYVEEVYWFKGHALAAQGNLVDARQAYESALEVNVNFYPAQQSLDWVNSLLGS